MFSCDTNYAWAATIALQRLMRCVLAAEYHAIVTYRMNSDRVVGLESVSKQVRKPWIFIHARLIHSVYMSFTTLVLLLKQLLITGDNRFDAFNVNLE